MAFECDGSRRPTEKSAPAVTLNAPQRRRIPTDELVGLSLYGCLVGGHILKSHLTVKDAWQVGLNDPDMVGVHRTDDVIIPEERKSDAPFLAYRDCALDKQASRRIDHKPKRQSANRRRAKISRQARKRIRNK